MSASVMLGLLKPDLSPKPLITYCLYLTHNFKRASHSQCFVFVLKNACLNEAPILMNALVIKYRLIVLLLRRVSPDTHTSLNLDKVSRI